MKRNHIMRRLMSLTLSAMLTVSMAGGLLVAEAATYTNTPIALGETRAGTDAQDVFYYANNTEASDTTKITDFEMTKDYIVCDVASPTITVNNGAATVTDGINALFIVAPKSGESISDVLLRDRIISTTTPIVRSIAASSATIEVGQTSTLTGTASFYDGTTSNIAYAWSGGSLTGQTANTTTVSGTPVGTATYKLTATAGGKSTSLPVTVTTTACPITSFSVTATPASIDMAGKQKTVTVSATPAPAPAGCKVDAHKQNIAFAIDESSKAAGITIAGSTITIPAEAVVIGSSRTINVTASKDGKVGTKTIAVTNSPACDAKLDTVTITEPNPEDGKINLVGNAAQTLNIKHSVGYLGTCTDSTHTVENNHGKTPVVSYTIKDGSPTGVSINENNQMVIAGTAPSGTITITASVEVEGVTKTAEKSIVFTRTYSTCTFLPTVAFDNPTGMINNTKEVLVNDTLTFVGKIGGTPVTGCSHTNDPNHGYTVGWEVTNLPAGMTPSDNGNNMTLTVNSLPTALSTNVTVRAYIKEKTATTTSPTNYTITRNGNCNKKFTGVTLSPMSGVVLESGNKAVFTVNSATASLQASPNYTGTCDYEANNLTCTHANAINHTPIWSIAPTVKSGSTAGISISSTGLLTVNYSLLGQNETAVTIKAKCGLAEQTGVITVRRGTLPSTGGGDSSDDRYDEEQKNSAAWDRVEFRIEDADNKDTIKVSMGSNIDMPTRVVRELIGENVTLELSVNGGFTWIINGKNLKKIPDYQLWIGLGVESIRDKDASKLAKYNDVRILELDHSGTFYGTYTLKQKVDSKYEGKYLYMYKYSDDANKLYYRGSAKVDNDGYVKFPFTSASTYVITDKALYGEAAGSTVGSGSSSGGNSSGGATVVTPPASSVAPPPASSTPSTSSSESSSSSSESASEIEPPSSSSQEVSRPADTEPEEPEEPEKKSIPLIIPILLAVVVVTVVAVILLAKGGMNFGG